jgi:hypothetical protein
MLLFQHGMPVLRFRAETWMCSTKAWKHGKRKSRIVEIWKGTDAVLWFCRNPQKRISVKARKGQSHE